jgi:UDP-N-acetylmuramyl pentapeptide phosphotransferase/UDP-N-acetylglucosamine-1-phosphate transferase
LGAGVIALAIVYYTSNTPAEAFVSWLALILTTNLINLLDLRPGRALKVFTVGMILLLGVYWQFTDIWYLAIPIVPVIFFYFPLDLSASAMMGDTGANLLGGILGYFLIQTVGFWGEVVIVFFLMFVHLFSERYSLSAMIEENRVLNWLDQLGRTRV